MKKRELIDLENVDRAGDIISTQYEYDLQYSTEKGCFVPATDEQYLLGVVEDSLLLERAKDFMSRIDSAEIRSKWKDLTDADDFFDFLEFVEKMGIKKQWNNYITPYKREIGLEWAAAYGLDSMINPDLPLDPIDPDIPEIICRKCGTVCNSSVDIDNIPSEVGGRRIRPVSAICPSCQSRYLLRFLNDGYEVGLHHLGDSHPFWAYYKRDELARNLASNPSTESELRLLFEQYHMRIHDDVRLKRILNGFKGRRRSPTNPDYVKAICFANLARVKESKPSELKALSGEGLTDVFAAAHLALSEDARGYSGKPTEILDKFKQYLTGSDKWYHYYFSINYLLNYIDTKAKRGLPGDWPFDEYEALILDFAKDVADTDCHDPFLKSLFCELLENMCQTNLPMRDEVLKECEKLFCKDRDYRGITAVVALKLGLYAVRDKDFELGAKHLNSIISLMKEDKDSGPFTSIRAIISGIMVAAIEEDGEKAALAVDLLTKLDRSVSMDKTEKLALTLPLMMMLDMEDMTIKTQPNADIIDLAEGFLLFPTHDYT